MDQVSLLEKKIFFYTKLYFMKKTDREEMEVEGERAKKTHKCQKPASSKPGPKLGGSKQKK